MEGSEFALPIWGCGGRKPTCWLFVNDGSWLRRGLSRFVFREEANETSCAGVLHRSSALQKA